MLVSIRGQRICQFKVVLSFRNNQIYSKQIGLVYKFHANAKINKCKIYMNYFNADTYTSTNTNT